MTGSITFFLLLYNGYDYYATSLSERFYHPSHEILKPSGFYGHGLGIIGSLMMLIGVGSYIARKRIRKINNLGLLKHWLEFHIFMCTVGPMLIIFHTAFKFGGIVSVSFWSMTTVVLSGMIGRYIYAQIPRGISGQQISLHQLKLMENELGEKLKEKTDLSEDLLKEIDAGKNYNSNQDMYNTLRLLLKEYYMHYKHLKQLKKELVKQSVSTKTKKEIVKLTREKLILNRRIEMLRTMQKLFRYWHIFHLPFAVIMLLIMLVHVAVAVAFGYRWIF